MEKLGKELCFISRLLRDGSGVQIVKENISLYDSRVFKLQKMSIIYETYLAINGNLFYVVKIK